MDPLINRTLNQPWHQLGEYDFERLCQRLFEVEESISEASLYGVRGQSQKGIDILAFRKDGDGVEVGQCKCYQIYTEKDLKAASDKFLEYWDTHWKDFDVKRFVLFVACDTPRTEVLDELAKQKKRFNTLGVNLELWNASRITKALRPYPEIVRQFATEDAVFLITGQRPTNVEPLADESRVHLSLVTNQLSSAWDELSSLRAEQFEGIKELFRQGKPISALEKLESIRRDSNWPHIEPKLRARILGQLAILHLILNSDTEQAKALQSEAVSHFSGFSTQFLRALIAYQEHNANAGLEVLDSPEDSHAFHLRLSLLIELGRAEDAISEADAQKEFFPWSAETRRVLALAHFTRLDLIAADVLIQEALEEQPTWASLRSTKGLLDYYSALSPAAHPGHVPHWPHPVDWELVKRDNSSRMKLRQAAQAFEELSKNVEQGAPPRHYNIWQLACLACDRDRQTDAEAYCKEILASEPDNARAMQWALAREYEIDTGSFESAVSARKELEPEQLFTWIAILIESQRANRAVESLNEVRNRNLLLGESEAWILWMVQALLAQGDVDRALEEAEKAKDPLARYQFIALAREVQAQRTKDWSAFAVFLEEAYKATNMGRFLYQYVRVKQYLGDFQSVISRASDLLKEVGTPAALYLVVSAAQKEENHQCCLDLLNQGEALFPEGFLPSDLHRLKVHCQERLGLIEGAIEAAKRHVRVEPTTANYLTLMNAQLHAGDMEGLVTSGRELLHQEDVQDPHEFLQAASLLATLDRFLGQKLWRKVAPQAESDPHLLTTVLDVGYRLGLDRQMLPYLKKVREFADSGQGSFKSLGFDDAKELLRDSARTWEDRKSQYESGILPVHLVTRELRTPLVDIYRGRSLRRGVIFSPLNNSPTMARHGGRPVQDTLNRTSRLHVDLTALLTAAHLGILDKVERYFNTLYLSPLTQVALLDQIKQIAPTQRSQWEAIRILARLLESDSLKNTSKLQVNTESHPNTPGVANETWEMLNFARFHDGVLVAHLPLNKSGCPDEHIEVAPSFSKHLISAHDLVAALKSVGGISESDYSDAMEIMGVHSLSKSSAYLKPGSLIILHDNNAETLAKAGVIERLCHTFDVYVSAPYAEMLRAGMTEILRTEELERWLKALIQRLADGVATEKYKFIADAPNKEGDKLAQEGRTNSELAVALTFLAHKPQKQDALWFDDRRINGYATRDGIVPVVDVLEVLRALLRDGELTPSEYFDKLHALRTSDYRYIPISAAEILHRIEQAKIENGRIIETPALTVIKRYISACLLDIDRLILKEWDLDMPSPPGEATFVLGLTHQVSLAIALCFIDTTAEFEAAACRADWLFKYMFTGMFGIRHLLERQSPDHGSGLIGIDIAEMLAYSFRINGSRSRKRKGKVSSREMFIRWLEVRLMEPRFISTPEARLEMIDTLQNAFRNIASEAQRAGLQKTAQVKGRLTGLLAGLPVEIRDDLRSEPGLATFLGLPRVNSVAIRGISFPSPEIWHAIASSLKGERAKIGSLDPKGMFEVTARIRRGSTMSITLKGRVGNKQRILKIKDPIMAILTDSIAQRETLLRQHLRWFDCEVDELERAIADIVSAENPRDRILKTESRRSQSAAEFYFQTKQAIHSVKGEQRFAFTSLMPPSAQGLLNHFRLRPNSPSDKAIIEEGTERLLLSEGIEETLLRLVNLPQALPLDILTKFSELPFTERKRISERIQKEKLSPLARIQRLHLVSFVGHEPDALQNELVSDVKVLLEEGNVEAFEVFHDLLRAVYEEFSYWDETESWSPDVRLLASWGHSSIIFDLFYSIGEAGESALRNALEFHSRIGPDLLSRNNDSWNHILHPHHLTWAELVGRGIISYASQVASHADIHDRLEALMYRDLGGDLVPVANDPSLTSNPTAAILSGSANDGPPVSELHPRMTSSGMMETVELALRRLQGNPAELTDWLRLFYIVSDRPIYPALKPISEDLLQELDIDAIYKQSMDAAYFAIRFSSSQAVYIQDSGLKKKITQDYIRFCSLLSEEWPWSSRPGTELQASSSLIVSLLDFALGLSIEPNNSNKSTARFIELMTLVSENWTELRRQAYMVAFRLGIALPAEQATLFWPLILRLRATPD